MTSGIVLILAVALVTYATRLAGFLLAARLKNRKESEDSAGGAGGPRSQARAAFDRFLGYVPVAAFAALIAPGLGFGTPEMLPRLLGAAIAAAVVLRVGHLWAGLAVGMATYWTVSALVLAV